MRTRKAPIPLALLLPILAALFVAVWGGGLGVMFMLLFDTSMHEWAVIVVGLFLVVGIPSAAAIFSRSKGGFGKEENQ